MKLQKLTTKTTRNRDARENGSRGKARATRRSYEDACGAAHGLDLVGERWALLVMRELMFGPRRFSDLKASLPGISANVLTQRLEGLEAAGIVEKQRLPPPASVQVYALTEWGLEAEPIFQALGRWAARSPAHDPALPLSAASLMLSFGTLFQAERARDVDLMVGFVFGEETFVVRVAGAMVTAARGASAGADVIFSGSPQAVAAAVHGDVPLAILEESGVLAVSGDRAAAERFTTLFSLPPPAGG
jgi:DNA-binding HxlR family transcriptional regulator